MYDGYLYVWTGVYVGWTLQNTAAHCNTLQHATTRCNALQRNATHFNTLHRTAMHCNTLMAVQSLIVAICRGGCALPEGRAGGS